MAGYWVFCFLFLAFTFLNEGRDPGTGIFWRPRTCACTKTEKLEGTEANSSARSNQETLGSGGKPQPRVTHQLRAES